MEVESRFVLTADSQARLLEGAELVEETNFLVEFLDTPEWKLAFSNRWLKRKNGRHELKIPLKSRVLDKTPHLATIFHEENDNRKILAELGLPHDEDFETALTRAMIRPFAAIQTKRTSYQKGRFRLDLDQAQFPLQKTGAIFHYNVAEIELEAAEDGVMQAKTDIIAFAELHGLVVSDTRGKLMEYVFQNHPDVYQEFVRRGLISK